MDIIQSDVIQKYHTGINTTLWQNIDFTISRYFSYAATVDRCRM